MRTVQASRAGNISWIRRVTAGVVLAAAPALIAIGAAPVGYADTTGNDPGSSVSAPTHYRAFPNQINLDVPGTPAHHHHQQKHQ